MFGSGLRGLAVMNGSRHSGWRHRENSFLLQRAPEISGQHDRYSSPRNLCGHSFLIQPHQMSMSQLLANSSQRHSR